MSVNSNLPDNEDVLNLKHDVKNQLSVILLAIENLKYEIGTDNIDANACLDSIVHSVACINILLAN